MNVAEILAIATTVLSIVTVLIAIMTAANSTRKDAFSELKQVVDEQRETNGNLIQAQARTELEVRYMRTSSIKLQSSILELISVIEKFMETGSKRTRADRDWATDVISRARHEISAAQSMNDDKDKTMPIPLNLVKEALGSRHKKPNADREM